MVSPMIQRFKSLRVLLIVLFFICGSWEIFCFSQSPQYIRVAIIQDAPTLNISIEGGYKLIDCHTDKVIYEDKDLKSTIVPYPHGLRMGEVDLNTDQVLLKTLRPQAITLKGRRFRGDIQIIKKENSRLAVINYLFIEDYVKGVLYHEASHHWPGEVLKAQAVISRTFALFRMQENKNNYYDVTSDIYSQVYGGRISERYRTNQAIKETQGLVLTYRKKIFPTYYHATCGGHTQDASLLWDTDILPLKGVVCGFCNESPHFRWHKVLKKKQVKAKLRSAGYKLNDISEIRVLGKDRSGRIISLAFLNDKDRLDISAKDFRNIVGPNVVRSTNFKIELVDDDIILEGIGWGHGVGLCQWGAYFMARDGKNFKQILAYYYPGSKIISISQLP